MSNKQEMVWYVGMNPGPIVYGPQGEQIADCRSPNFTPNESGQHAKLIAAVPRMVGLLKKASGKLQEYCAETNGDLNDSLTLEIDTLLTKTGIHPI